MDFSVPVALKKLSTIQYQATNNSFSPVNTTSLDAFLAVDGYYPRVDVKTQNWTRYPHPLVGVAFAKQPLSKILLAGAWDLASQNSTWARFGQNNHELPSAPAALVLPRVLRQPQRIRSAIVIASSSRSD